MPAKLEATKAFYYVLILAESNFNDEVRELSRTYMMKYRNIDILSGVTVYYICYILLFHYNTIFGERKRFVGSQNQRNFMMEVVCENAKHADDSIKVAAYEDLVQAVSEYYDFMAPYMPIIGNVISIACRIWWSSFRPVSALVRMHFEGA